MKEWSPALIEEAFGLNRGDVLSMTTGPEGCSVECAPSVPAETVAEINRVVLCDAPRDIEAWRAMQERLKQGSVAYNKWGSLTVPQKDTVLKNILSYILYQERIL